MKYPLLLVGVLAIAHISFAQTANTHRDDSFVLDLSGAGALAFSPDEFPLTRVLPLSDGKILFYGSLHTPLQTEISGVARLHADGSWDNSFDGPDFNEDYYLKVHCAVELPDGKYLVAGTFQDFSGGTNQKAIIRLHPDGSQDMDFDAAFLTSTINAIALQPDGKILIAGPYSSMDHGTGITRLHPDGTVDDTFDAQNQAPMAISDIKVLPNGQILVAGRFSSWSGGLAVLNSDGSRDPSFSHSGYIHSSAIYDNVYPRTAIQADGKIVVAGLQTSNTVKIIRYNADFSIDTSFHVANNAQINGVYPTGVAVQSDGKIVVTGYFLNAYDGVDWVSGVMRLNADGTLDETFNPANGFGNNSLVYHCAIQADGKILLVTQNSSYQGETISMGGGFPTNQHIIRLNGDGVETGVAALDASFSFALLPNPAHDQIEVRLHADAAQTLHLDVLDVMGRRERSMGTWAVQGSMREQWNIAALAAGTYLLRIRGANGVWTTRFVKE